MIGRGRLLLALVVAVGAVAAAFASERLGPAARGSLQAAVPRSGAWFCPHGGGEGWRAWVVVANPAAVEAEVVVTTLGSDDPVAERSTLEPGRQRLVPVPATDPGGGTTVEYFGAAVGAGMIVARPQDAGMAAEPCAPETGRLWHVPEGTTVRGQGTRIVVLNPTGTEAVVDVALLKDDELVQPGRLEGVVLQAGEGTAVDIGKVALGERTVTAIVTASLGEVVVSGIGTTSEGLRSVLGVPALTTFAALPGAVDAVEGEVVVMAPAGDAPLRVDAVDADGPRPEIQDASVEGGSAETFGVRGGDVTIAVRSEGEAGFVVARRLSARTQPGGRPDRPPGGKGGKQGKREPRELPPAPTPDAAAIAQAAPASGWLIPTPLTPEGGRSVLSLYNPGPGSVTVDVTLLTAEGSRAPRGLRGIEIGAGRASLVGLTESAGEAPVTALVEVGGGRVVAAQTGVAEGGYAVTSGVSWPPGLTY